MIKLQTDLIQALNTAPADSTLVNTAKEIDELKTLSFDDLVDRLMDSAVNFAVNIALAIFVFYLGRFIIRKIYKVVSTIFIHRQFDKSLSTFILSLINIVLYFILIVTVIGILGIETSSFLAIFASAGVAIGMALSGTLQNFAGGVLILLLKPYKIGDYIEVQGYAGTVREIQIFHTIITTYDNKSISIPNGGLSTGSVNNWSREAYRRVTWDVSISYGDDVAQAREAILAMFAEDSRIEKAEADADASSVGDAVEYQPEDADAEVDDDNATDDDAEVEEPKRSLYDRILCRHRYAKSILRQREQRRREAIRSSMKKPDYSPKVLVNELGASSVDLQVRAWCKTGEYWNVFYCYTEKFYNELPKHGIHFPFPQMDVHITK